MDGGAWWAAVHGVAKSRTRLSVFTFTFHFHALEKEMATHSSVLAWRIPGTWWAAVYGVARSQTRLKRLSSSSSSTQKQSCSYMQRIHRSLPPTVITCSGLVSGTVTCSLTLTYNASTEYVSLYPPPVIQGPSTALFP